MRGGVGGEPERDGLIRNSWRGLDSFIFSLLRFIEVVAVGKVV